MSTKQNILVWLRNDLRMGDNPALCNAVKLALDLRGTAKVYACVIMSPQEDLRHQRSANQIDFYLRNLKVLSSDLMARHRIPLLFRVASDAQQVPILVKQLALDLQCKHVLWNNQYEVDESRRDQKVQTLLEAQQIDVHRFHDQLVVPPRTLTAKSTGNCYTVYSPYRKAWQQHVYENQDLLHLNDALPFQNGKDAMEKPNDIPESLSEFPVEAAVKMSMLTEFPAGESVAQEKLKQYAEVKMSQYKEKRDFPAQQYTSKLSPYLAIGVLSGRQCIVEAMRRNGGKLDSGNAGAVTWIQEVIWREFYKEILVCFPRVCMNRPYKLETERVEWLYDQAQFDAWCQGKTGYPIVDAAMRQLNATGWMHNRLRMIVASFLTKHMLHNWQHGEKYFSQHLIDCDFSSNNGGWQWSASTGNDGQPYFRVFNPLLQSQRFDPDGKFIKQWVPELKDLKTAAAVHYPQKELSSTEFAKLNYPQRLVEHELGRSRAIAAFEAIRGGADDKKISNSPVNKQASKKSRKQ